MIIILFQFGDSSGLKWKSSASYEQCHQDTYLSHPHCVCVCVYVLSHMCACTQARIGSKIITLIADFLTKSELFFIHSTSSTSKDFDLLPNWTNYYWLMQVYNLAYITKKLTGLTHTASYITWVVGCDQVVVRTGKLLAAPIQWAIMASGEFIQIGCWWGRSWCRMSSLGDAVLLVGMAYCRTFDVGLLRWGQPEIINISLNGLSWFDFSCSTSALVKYETFWPKGDSLAKHPTNTVASWIRTYDMKVVSAAH